MRYQRFDFTRPLLYGLCFLLVLLLLSPLALLAEETEAGAHFDLSFKGKQNNRLAEIFLELINEKRREEDPELPDLIWDERLQPLSVERAAENLFLQEEDKRLDGSTPDEAVKKANEAESSKELRDFVDFSKDFSESDAANIREKLEELLLKWMEDDSNRELLLSPDKLCAGIAFFSLPEEGGDEAPSLEDTGKTSISFIMSKAEAPEDGFSFDADDPESWNETVDLHFSVDLADPEVLGALSIDIEDAGPGETEGTRRYRALLKSIDEAFSPEIPAENFVWKVDGELGSFDEPGILSVKAAGTAHVSIGLPGQDSDISQIDTTVAENEVPQPSTSTTPAETTEETSEPTTEPTPDETTEETSETTTEPTPAETTEETSETTTEPTPAETTEKTSETTTEPTPAETTEETSEPTTEPTPAETTKETSEATTEPKPAETTEETSEPTTEPTPAETTAEPTPSETPEAFDFAMQIELDGTYHFDPALNLLYEINRIRTNAGLQPLLYDMGAQEAAERRALDSLVWKDHRTPDGYTLDYENLYHGEPINADELIQKWMNEEENYLNILNPEYSSFAVGMYEIKGEKSLSLSALFGHRTAAEIVDYTPPEQLDRDSRDILPIPEGYDGMFTELEDGEKPGERKISTFFRSQAGELRIPIPLKLLNFTIHADPGVDFDPETGILRASASGHVEIHVSHDGLQENADNFLDIEFKDEEFTPPTTEATTTAPATTPTIEATTTAPATTPTTAATTTAPATTPTTAATTTAPATTPTTAATTTAPATTPTTKGIEFHTVPRYQPSAQSSRSGGVIIQTLPTERTETTASQSQTPTTAYTAPSVLASTWQPWRPPTAAPPAGLATNVQNHTIQPSPAATTLQPTERRVPTALPTRGMRNEGEDEENNLSRRLMIVAAVVLLAAALALLLYRILLARRYPQD